MSVLLDALKKAAAEKKAKQSDKPDSAARVERAGLTIETPQDQVPKKNVQQTTETETTPFSLNLIGAVADTRPATETNDNEPENPPVSDTKKILIASEEPLLSIDSGAEPFEKVDADSEKGSSLKKAQAPIEPAVAPAEETTLPESKPKPEAITLKLAENVPDEVAYQPKLTDLDALDEPAISEQAKKNTSQNTLSQHGDDAKLTHQHDEKADLNTESTQVPPLKSEKEDLNPQQKSLMPEPNLSTEAKRVELEQILAHKGNDFSKKLSQPLQTQGKGKDKPTGNSAPKKPKKVQALFSPILTSTLKPNRSAFRRRLFFYFSLISFFILALSYFALYFYQTLDAQHEQEVRTFSPMVMTQPSTPVEPAEPSETHLAEPTLSEVEKIEELESKPQVAKVAPPASKPTQMPLSTSQKSPSAQTTRPAQNLEVVRSVRRSDTELAYEAYLAGDFQQAQVYYQRDLAANPRSQTSQLGLAAIAAERGEYAEAMRRYQMILAQDPQDSDALHGVAAIASALGDTRALEDDLRLLVRRYPNSPVLQFALGNSYAQRQDWFKAQQHYFESVRLESQNPDYRLNLAVSLDHLGRFEDALTQYKQSLALAEGENNARFHRDSVYQRILILQEFVGRN